MPFPWELFRIVATFPFIWVDGDRGGDVPKMRALLEGIDGVKVLDVVGWDGGWPSWTPINITADLEVGGGGRLRVGDLTMGTFTHERPFLLARVGPWEIDVYWESEMKRGRFVAGCPLCAVVGPGSALSRLASRDLVTIDDLVAHYEDLLRMVEGLPERYSVVDVGTDRIHFFRRPFRERCARRGILAEADASS